MTGIRANDCQAIKRFTDYFYGRTLRLVCRKIGRSCEDCRDLVSEILWETIVKVTDGSFNEEKGRLASYLYGITNNSCKNYFKHKKMNPQVAFSEEAASDPDRGSGTLEQKISLLQYQRELEARQEAEMYDLLEKAIQRLEEKYSKLIYLKYYRQYSYEQISQEEKIPVAKVKSRLFEARKKLEKNVQKMLNLLSNISR